MRLREGTYLQNRYEVLSRVGSGGMSDVYKALDHKLNRTIAIKVLKEEYSADPAFVSKFKIEAQSAAGLSHPNIVQVYDVVDEGELHYIVMELVEGVTLKNFIKAKVMLANREATGIAIQIAQGIEAAHQLGIVHRDIKPQNIILSSDGKVKVADFGIAKAASQQTLMSEAMGSVHYISPEQAKGEMTDARGDIYSLGITMFEMVTGRLPYEGDNTVSVAIAHVEKPMPLPSTYNPSVSRALEFIILKCTQKKPERRYQSISETIVDLRRAMIDPDADLSSQAVSEDDDPSRTKPISQRELGEINARVSAGNAGQRQTKPQRTRKAEHIDDEPEDYHDHIFSEKLVTAGGVLFSVLIIAVAIFIGIKVFRSVAPTISQVASTAETTADSSLKDTEVYVPDVVGKSEDVAKAMLLESSLEIKYSDPQSSDTVPEGSVISQEPEGGSVAMRWTEVYVVLSSGSLTEDLTQLDLIGKEGSVVRAALEDKGYIVQMSEETSDTVEKDRVCRVDPENPTKGATVTVYVSKGSESELVKVPTLIGQTEDVAIGLLVDSQLVPGEVSSVSSVTVPAGTVISQTILADTEVEKGTSVGYVVSSGSSTQYHYVASIDETYNLNSLIGPGAEDTKVSISIRLHQVVDGEDVYTVLMEPREISASAILPVRFRNIEGAEGVETGEVEVVEDSQNAVLRSYTVTFFKVE
jgi:eukaryotic-like serine/threonine-protein kinase